MEKEITNLTLRRDIKERANKAINRGLFPGTGSLSALVEKALDQLLNSTKGA